MRNDDEKKLKNHLIHDDDHDDSGESGTGTSTGGAAGDIDFHYQDILSVGLRDDLVTGKELKRILAVHEDLHKSRVDNQKIKRQERKLLKEGRASLTSSNETVRAHRARMGSGGGGGGRSSPYKKHPISDKAQFSGIDNQVSMLPSNNAAETNKEQRDNLENRNELKNRLTHSNKYTPKPRPY